MRKLLALLLALILCIGIFAACAEETREPDSGNDDTTPPADDSTTPDDTENPDNTETPDDTDETLKPGLQADGTTFVGVLDMTDEFTLVIERPGTSGDERVGVVAEKGKVEVGAYNTAGNKRTASYVLDWASLGLEGHAWEYFGSTFKLDVSDAANPKLLNKPEKTSYIFVYSQISVSAENIVTLPDGKTFNPAEVHYGMIRPNNLLNEGGWYIPKWNDLSGGSVNIYTEEKFMKDYYFYCRCELYDQEMTLYMPTAPSDYDGPLSPNDEKNTPSTPDTPVMPTTPAEIVDAAWALEKGTELGDCSLTGKIVSIATAWSAQYSNITVSIVVEGKEDKPIVAYRLKGDGAEGLAVGDTITVTGTLVNYADSSEKGLVEFKSGCTVSNIVKGEAPTEPDTPTTHTHSWDAGKVTKEASCKEAGVKTFTCSCGETKTEEIKKTNDHKYDEGKVTKEATCKDAGVKTFTCSVCGNTKTEEIKKTDDHKYDEGKVTKEATCKDAGVKTFTCSVCGETKTEEIKKTDDHKYDVKIDGASLVYTCTVCGTTQTQAYSKPGLQADGKTFVGVMDMTDVLTLVIETPGTSGDNRIGVLSAAGKVEVGVYNTMGSRRTAKYVLDWASLGLTGNSWEYLGSTFILDVSDAANPKLLNKPAKSAYVFVYSQISVSSDNIVTLPDGTKFNPAEVHYGMIRPNSLANEGGAYIPNWNDLGGGSVNIYTMDKFFNDYYFYCNCELYGQAITLYMSTAPAGYTGPLSPNASN